MKKTTECSEAHFNPSQYLETGFEAWLPFL